MSDNLTVKQIRDGWSKLHDQLVDMANQGRLTAGEHDAAQLKLIIGVVFNLLNNIEELENKLEVSSGFNLQNGLPH